MGNKGYETLQIGAPAVIGTVTLYLIGLATREAYNLKRGEEVINLMGR